MSYTYKTMEAPLPADYQTALEEILKLRNKLSETNSKWAKATERRVLDNRAAAGNIKVLNAECAEYRKQIKELRARLEKLITKETPL